MRVGVPTEVKQDEHRVALTPAGARELRGRRDQVLVQAGAGEGSAIADSDYAAQGAELAPDVEALFAGSELIVKVKEPQPPELALLRSDHLLFCCLHPAPDPELTDGLLDSGAACIAYETITDACGGLPLLVPMSESPAGSRPRPGRSCWSARWGGRGVLLGGVPGVAPGRVMVIGGGVVGSNAARVALALGAEVEIYDRSIERLRELDSLFAARAATCLRLGARDRAAAARGRPGDRRRAASGRQGAAGHRPIPARPDEARGLETSRPTTHCDPPYEVAGVSHYCVANMLGAVPITSTHALANAIMPYVLELADRGAAGALGASPHFAAGLNIARGRLANGAVARTSGGRGRSRASSSVARCGAREWLKGADGGSRANERTSKCRSRCAR